MGTVTIENVLLPKSVITHWKRQQCFNSNLNKYTGIIQHNTYRERKKNLPFFLPHSVLLHLLRVEAELICIIFNEQVYYKSKAKLLL